MDPLQTFATPSQELSAVSVHTKLSSTTIIQSCNYEHGHICIHDHQIDVVESSGCDACQLYQYCESGLRFPPTVDEDPELIRTDLYDLKAHLRHICRQQTHQVGDPQGSSGGKLGSEGLQGVEGSAAAVEDPAAGGAICSAAGGRGTSSTPSTAAVEDRLSGVDLRSLGAGSKPGADPVHPAGSGVDFDSFGVAGTSSALASALGDRGSGTSFGGGSSGSRALLGGTASAAGSTAGAVTAQGDLGGYNIDRSRCAPSTSKIAVVFKFGPGFRRGIRQRLLNT